MQPTPGYHCNIHTRLCFVQSQLVSLRTLGQVWLLDGVFNQCEKLALCFVSAATITDNGAAHVNLSLENAVHEGNVTVLPARARPPCRAQSNPADDLCFRHSDQFSLTGFVPFIGKLAVQAAIAHACECWAISGNINENIPKPMVCAVRETKVCGWVYSKLQTRRKFSCTRGCRIYGLFV